jgi:hypothetical protein
MTAALFKHMLYLVATVTSVAILFLTTYLPQGVWLVAPALLFLNVTLETALWQRTVTIAIAGSCAVIGILLGGLLAPNFIAQAIYLIIVVGICAYYASIQQKYAYPLFVVSFLILLTLHADGDWQMAISHAQTAAVGVIVVLVAQLILLPFAAVNEYQRSKVLVYKALSDLAAEIFSCLTSPDYPANVYLFERRVHAATSKCLDKIALLGQRAGAVGETQNSNNSDVQSLFETMMDLSQIRWRVSDHTVFQLCSIELSEIELAMIAVLNAFPNTGKAAYLEKCIVHFERGINRLEDNLEHIVKVAAREPVVFILFLAALKAMLSQFKNMAEIEFLDTAEAA